MVSDSQATRGSTPSTVTKLFRGPDGSVCGLCGDFGPGMALIDFICGRSEVVPDFMGADTTVIQLRRDGIWTYDNSVRPFRIAEPFFAIGSGGDIALGAMFTGAPPDLAVKGAIRFDVYTGGRLQIMALESEKPKRKKRDAVS